MLSNLVSFELASSANNHRLLLQHLLIAILETMNRL